MLNYTFFKKKYFPFCAFFGIIIKIVFKNMFISMINGKEEIKMKDNNELHHDIKKLIIGISILSLLSFCISLIWGFKIEFLLGTLIGLIFTCFNMIFLGIIVTKSINMEQGKAKKLLFSSYLLRYSVFGVIFAISVYSSCINILALILPLFYPRIVLSIITFYERKEEA